MSTPTPAPADITTVLMQDVALTVEAIVAAVLAQRAGADNASADAQAVIADTVKAVKDAVAAIPQIPAFAASFLESDAILVPFVTNITAMLEAALGKALNKVEGK